MVTKIKSRNNPLDVNEKQRIFSRGFGTTFGCRVAISCDMLHRPIILHNMCDSVTVAYSSDGAVVVALVRVMLR